MKNYSSKTKDPSRRSSKTRWWIGALVLVLLLGWLAPVVPATVSSVVFYPVHAVRVWVMESEHSLALFIQEKHELIERISELERHLAERSGTAQTITRLQDENETLRSLLNQEQPERIAARVLARPNQVPYDILHIDRGRADGVVVDAPVYMGVDQVIGFVFYAARDYSLVHLVTTPRYSATAYVIGPDIYTTAEGVGGGMLRVRVPQGVSVEEGDLVILPAVSSGIYGEIVHIETTPTQPEQYGYVALEVPLQSLRYVTIGQNPIRPTSFAEAAARVERARDDLFQVEIPREFQVATGTATTTDEQRASEDILEESDEVSDDAL